MGVLLRAAEPKDERDEKPGQVRFSSVLLQVQQDIA
jgi:hypothetical protein